jgi:uncharacterized Tic20 family protein
VQKQLPMPSPGGKPALQPTPLERFLAGCAHLSGFIAPFLAPLLIWIVARKWLPFTARHARQALVSHLLTWLTIGILALAAVVVFLLLLGGTASVPPAGGGIQLVYFIIFVLLVLLALLAWLVGQINFVYGAIRAWQGKPARAFAFWRKQG